MANNLQVLILAAGKGTRMKSDVPKVLHSVIGITMIDHVIMKAKLLRPSKISVMINRDLLYLKKKYANIHFLLQEPQLGTGHAVQIFQKQNKSKNTKLLILYGDNPLIDLIDLKKIKLQLRNNDLAILGFNCHDNYSYGIIIEQSGVVDEIVEFKDANKKQRKITICNSGVMALGTKALNLVNKIQNNNVKKEFYLTDIVKLSKKYNHRIKLVTAKDSKAALGINDMYELGVAENIMQDQLRKKVMKQGVRLIAPETVFLSKDTKFGKNVTIEPYVVIGSNVTIGNGSIVKSFSHIEGATIKNKVVVGPYARIRPGAVLEEGSKIGNFVEIKKSTVGKKSKVNHLSYIGDSEIGKSVNIGAGTITCNYDGVKKSKTKIKDKVFVGSNSSLVAPLTIEKESIIGAGSVITKSVKKKSLALTRSLQTEIKNYKRK